MSQTLSLYRLQQIDSQMDRLHARLNEIQRLLDDDTELRRLKEQVETADARCLSAEEALREAEGNVQDQIIKIEQTQSSLYGGKSHSPKELQDLQNDLFALKRHLTTLEDHQIDAMQESETANAEQQLSHAKLEAALNNYAELSNGLHHEQEMIKNELERFTIERNAVAVAIPASDLSLYDQLRKQRRGIAVAVISENSCGACGTILNRAQIQSARSADNMLQCPSCGRILYRS
jgi:uncharacterized protein